MIKFEIISLPPDVVRYFKVGRPKPFHDTTRRLFEAGIEAAADAERDLEGPHEAAPVKQLQYKAARFCSK